jgi:tetratricopeptide (TPR) repeat protein
MRVIASFALLSFLCTSVSAASPSSSAAGPSSDEVKAQVRKATGEYNLGQYLEAARDYEAAYLQTLDPNLIFNVAQSYRLAGEIDKAITAYRSYLRSNPRGEQRVLAETKLRELEDRRAAAPFAPAAPVAPAPATTPAPAVAPIPAAPIPAPQVAAPANVAAPGAGAAMADAPSSGQGNVLVTAPSSETPKADPFYKRWPFWVGTGVVVAGAVVAGVLLTSGGSNLSMPSATLGTKDF